MDDSKQPDLSRLESPLKSFVSESQSGRKSILGGKNTEEEIFITENKDDLNP